MRWGGPVTGHAQVGRHGRITFTHGVAVFHTVRGALRLIDGLYRRAWGGKGDVSLRSVRLLESWQAKILYERAIPCALATLQVSSPFARIELCSGIFEFVRGLRSLDGLESLMLSAILAARYHEPRVAEVGMALWRRLAGRALPKSSKEVTPVIDVGRGQMSFLTGAQLAASIGEAPVGGEIFGGLPGFGSDASDASSQGCIKAWTVAGLVVAGIAGGAAAYGATEAAKGKTWEVTVDVTGGIVVAGLGGAQGGQSLGTAFCTNTSPAVPDGIAGVLLGEGPAPSTTDDQGYNAGFQAGYAAARGDTTTGPGPGAQYGQGFADGYAVGGFVNTPTTFTSPDGTVTTTMPSGTITQTSLDGTTVVTTIDGTTTATSLDGTVVISTVDGTTSTVSPEGSITTTSADGSTVTTNSADGTVTTTTTSEDGASTTTTTSSDGSSTTTTSSTSDTDSDDNLPPDDFPDPDAGGPAPGGPVGVNIFPTGSAVDGLTTAVSVGSSYTYFITGMPQLAIGGGIASAGILAGASE